MTPTVGTTPQGFGHPRVIPIAQPAVGAEFTHTVPTGAVYEWVGLYAELDSNATSTSRRLQLVLNDGTNDYWFSASQSFSNANSTHTQAFYNSGQIIGGVINIAPHQIAMPSKLFLPEGHIVKSVTTGIQSGDQIKNVFWTVLEHMMV